MLIGKRGPALLSSMVIVSEGKRVVAIIRIAGMRFLLDQDLDDILVELTWSSWCLLAMPRRYYELFRRRLRDFRNLQAAYIDRNLGHDVHNWWPYIDLDLGWFSQNVYLGQAADIDLWHSNVDYWLSCDHCRCKVKLTRGDLRDEQPVRKLFEFVRLREILDV